MMGGVGRVLMVVRPSKGGAFGHVVRLAAALAERRPRGRDRRPPRLRTPTGLGRRGDRGRDGPGDHARAPTPAAVAALARAYASFRPDLIHAHGSKGGGRRPPRACAAPRHPAGADAAQLRVHELVLEPRRARAPTGRSRSRSRRSRPGCSASARRSGGSRATVGPPSRTRVVYNGIEPLRPIVEPDRALARAARRRARCSPRSPSCSRRRGCRAWSRRCRRSWRAVPAAQLAIAGEGPQRSEIEAQIDRLGLGERSSCSGRSTDVPGLLAAADVFVAPGWSESFPYAILEAMSVGLPIVATDVGGVGEAIEDGVTGRLVPGARPGGARRRAASSCSTRPELRRGARERRAASAMRERFTFERMLDGTLGVYAEVGVRSEPPARRPRDHRPRDRRRRGAARAAARARPPRGRRARRRDHAARPRAAGAAGAASWASRSTALELPQAAAARSRRRASRRAIRGHRRGRRPDLARARQRPRRARGPAGCGLPVVWGVHIERRHPRHPRPRRVALQARRAAPLGARPGSGSSPAPRAPPSSCARRGYPEARIETVPNGFDLDALPPGPGRRAAIRTRARDRRRPPWSSATSPASTR